MRFSVQSAAAGRPWAGLAVVLLGLLTLATVMQAADQPAGGEPPVPAPNPPEGDNDLLMGLVASLQARVAKLEASSAGDNDPYTFRAYWKNGLRFTTRNNAFDLTVGGRLQADTAFFRVDRKLANLAAIGGAEKKVPDQAELRRVRLMIGGTFYQHGIFKVEFDFAGDSNPAGKAVVAMKDVYVGLKRLPIIGTVRIGHYREFFGLDELTSSLNLTFLERSLPDAFAPAFNLGIGINNSVADDRVTYALGVFHDVGDSGNAVGAGRNGKYNWTARVTGLPCYENKGQQVIHFGLSFSARNPNAPAGTQTVTFASRPEVHLAPNFVSTGAQAADSVLLLSPELAAAFGSFWLQGEYLNASLSRPKGSGQQDASFSSYYGAAGFFLTGETRPYKKSDGVWDRVQPLHNFLDGDGCGAWELAVRFSAIDLEDTPAGVYGGKLNDITVGLNWYLNPNLRFYANYVNAHLSQKLASPPNNNGSADVGQFRVQADF